VDVSQLSNVLPNVLKLKAVDFHWKTGKYLSKYSCKRLQIGFVAQEFERVFPELVRVDNDGYKTVDFLRLTPIIVEAIKEQQDVITGQRKTLDELALKVSDLEGRLTSAVKLQQEADDGKTLSTQAIPAPKKTVATIRKK